MIDIFFLFIQVYAGVLCYVTLIWLISLYLKDSSIMDIFWGAGFIYIYFLSNYLSSNSLTPSLNNFILTLFILLWGLRLTVFLFIRNRQRPEDIRYQNWRIQYGQKWWWYSYFHVFALQGTIMFIVSMPLILAINPQSYPNNILFLIGILIWIIGFLFESIADYQLYQFKLNAINFDKVCKNGLWDLCRHPNYFGETLVWWGFFLITYQYNILLISPILMTFLLLKVSGVKMLDDILIKKNPEYEAYIKTHNAFIPNIFKGSIK